MDVHVDGWARFGKDALTADQIADLKKRLTIHPRKVGDHPGDPPGPIECFKEENGSFYVPRSYFFQNTQGAPRITTDLTEGDKTGWTDLVFSKVEALEEDQERGVTAVLEAFEDDRMGGILQAAPGWGKTVVAMAIIARMNVPTLVTVHKTFLLNQWKKRIARFLPNAKVGIAREGKCEYEGNHIVIGINTSLHVRQYPDEFYRHFGLVISDEVHRIGAPTWSNIPPKFNAKWRLGLSATPRRSDGAQDLFFNHIGPLVFKGRVEMLAPQIKRVFSKTYLPESMKQNPSLITSMMATRLLCANMARNEEIVSQLIRACQAGRKILLLSAIRERHVVPLEALFRRKWPQTSGPCPTTSFYLGGMKDHEFDEAEDAQVIFATSQMAKEGLDIPPLDTLFLTTPMGNVEQAVGRIQRKCVGKKDPVVVDFRDDSIAVCKRLGEARWRFYEKKEWV